MDSLRRYFHRDILVILLLGFSSGLPLALAGGTFKAWLKKSGIDLTTIGYLTYLTLPYSLKFLWAPLIDRLEIPYLTRRFGKRRGWMLFCQGGIVLSLAFTAFTNPGEALLPSVIGALLIAFCSASQDVVIDGYRAEYLSPTRYGEGATVAILGYRIGMLVAGAGALYLSDILPWREVYLLMASCVGVGFVTVLLAREPKHPEEPEARGADWLRQAIVAPFASFARAYPAWLALLIFLALFRLPESFIGAILMPFYIDLGFTNSEIAKIAKLYGFGATIFGAFLGGMAVARWGVWKALMVIGLLQIPGNLIFLLPLETGRHAWALAAAITAENLVAGALGTAVAVFLMGLCDLRYTATQFALLSAIATLSANLLSGPSGQLAQAIGYGPTFIASAFFGLPALVILWRLRGEKVFVRVCAPES